VRTDGGKGGTFTVADGERAHYAPLPTVVTGDTYGAGDTFAAALTFALGQKQSPADAVAFAAARAAEVVQWVGPYPSESQQ
jgi:ribokinase